MSKTGLVLEGGAMRGMYTAAILDAMIENDIKVDGVIGVSAGTLFGVNYLSNQPGRAIRYNKRYNKEKEYMGIGNFLRTGTYVNVDYAYGTVPRELDPFDAETFNNSGVPFYAVITNIDTGKAEYIELRDAFPQMDVMRASGSMPFFSKPVELTGELRNMPGDKTRYYLDGGISDSIPFEWMSNAGYDKLIVVLTRDINYRKGSMVKPLVNLWYHKKPNLCKALMNRHIKYNQSIETLLEWEKEGRALVIRPSVPLNISRTERDPDKLQDVYDIGELDAKHYIPLMKEYLK